MRIIECMNITLAHRIAYYCIAQIIYVLTIYYELINFQIEFDTIKKEPQHFAAALFYCIEFRINLRSDLRA